MNPYRLKNVFEYLTSNNQLLKKKLKLGTSEIPIPPKRDDVTTIEAINRFSKANPRVDTTNLKPLSVKQSNVKKPDEAMVQGVVSQPVRTVDPERDSFKKISNVLGAYKKYRRGEKNPKLNFNKFFELYSTENFAEGGRAGYEDGGMLVQPSDDGSRPGYKGNIGQQKVSKKVSESSKKINKNINKWATNWFNKNQKNYGVRDFEKMKNDFTNAWSTELKENLKKYEGYGVTKKTLKMSDSGLPIIKDGISIDGIKFVTRADRAGNNPDLAWERLFYKNKLKNKDFKTQLKQYVEWATANKRKNPNLLDPNVKFGSAAQSKTGTLEYGKKFKGFNDDVIFFMGDVLNKKTLNPGGTIKGVTDVFKETLGKDADNYFKKFKGSWNVWVDNFRAVGKLAGLDDSMIDALLKKQTSDTQKIMKLYNVENLPLEFRVAQDHLFGLAEAKALGDPKIASQTLKNLVASTKEQNRVLGQEGFSNKRVSLIKKFKNANLENKTNIINQLNTLADEYVPGRLKYNIKKDGSLKITNLQPETTLKAKTSAYESMTETFPKNIKPINSKKKANILSAFCNSKRKGLKLAGSVDGLACSMEEIQTNMQKQIDQAAKVSKDGKIPKRFGKLTGFAKTFFGDVAIPLEYMFAAPYLAAGDIEGAKRATTVGLFGYGKVDLDKLPEGEGQRFLKHINALNSFMDNYQSKAMAENELENASDDESRFILTNRISEAAKNMKDISLDYQTYGYDGQKGLLQGKVAAQQLIRDQVQSDYDKKINKSLNTEFFKDSDKELLESNIRYGDKENDPNQVTPITDLESYIRNKGEATAGNTNLFFDVKPYTLNRAEAYGVPDIFDQYAGGYAGVETPGFIRDTGEVDMGTKSVMDAYSSLPIEYASQLAALEKKQFEEGMLKKDIEQKITSSDPLQFASGGIASLTDTIPPESGPTPQGLPYVYNNVKKI